MALTGNGKGRAGYPIGEDSGDVARRKFAAQCGLDEDDPMLPLLQANAQLETKVEQWSTAILELAALARQQNQAMQETSQNSLRLTSTLNSSAQESQQLQRLIAQLSNSLIAQKQTNSSKPSPELTQSALQTLVPMLNSLNQTMEDMQRQIDRVRTDQLIWNANEFQIRRWGWWFLLFQVMVCFGLIMGVRLHNTQVLTEQARLAAQASWQLTKLERIEKALGIDQKQQ
jgi:hypothetical protein